MPIFRTPPQVVKPGRSDTIIVHTDLAVYEITVRQHDGNGDTFERIVTRPNRGNAIIRHDDDFGFTILKET